MLITYIYKKKIKLYSSFAYDKYAYQYNMSLNNIYIRTAASRQALNAPLKNPTSREIPVRVYTIVSFATKRVITRDEFGIWKCGVTKEVGGGVGWVG